MLKGPCLGSGCFTYWGTFPRSDWVCDGIIILKSAILLNNLIIFKVTLCGTMASKWIPSTFAITFLVRCQSMDKEDSIAHQNEDFVDQLFPFHDFTAECSPSGHSYETTFTFLEGMGRGFVHAEPHRIFFEYYFPAEHWVGFAAADQSIVGEEDECTQCYYQYLDDDDHNETESNLWPNCIEQCLDESVFVATVNGNESNPNQWDVMEFQVERQISKKVQKCKHSLFLSLSLSVWSNDKNSVQTLMRWHGASHSIHLKHFQKSLSKSWSILSTFCEIQ